MPQAASAPAVTFRGISARVMKLMIRYLLCGLATFLVVSTALADPAGNPLVQRNWFETRTAYFNVYSCGSTQEVSRLTARLEQFREAYSLLAGTNAVASP